MMPRICGPFISALEPKPPPRKGERIRMFAGSMPKSWAMRPCPMVSAWLGVSTVSLSPSHCATMAWGSMAL